MKFDNKAQKLYKKISESIDMTLDARDKSFSIEDVLQIPTDRKEILQARKVIEEQIYRNGDRVSEQLLTDFLDLIERECETERPAGLHLDRYGFDAWRDIKKLRELIKKSASETSKLQRYSFGSSYIGLAPIEQAKNIHEMGGENKSYQRLRLYLKSNPDFLMGVCKSSPKAMKLILTSSSAKLLTEKDLTNLISDYRETLLKEYQTKKVRPSQLCKNIEDLLAHYGKNLDQVLKRQARK